MRLFLFMLLLSSLLAGREVTALMTKTFPDALPESGFTLLAKGTLSVAQTRFAITHDGKNIMVRIEADEPEMDSLRANPGLPRNSSSIYRNDAVELNFDPSGSGLTFYKLIIDSDGNLVDYLATDNNTNTDTFLYDSTWDSHAVISSKKFPDKWTLDVAVPFGAFDIQQDSKTWRFNVGRNRYAGGQGTLTLSSYAPLSKNSYSIPREFAKVHFADFEPKRYLWRVENLDFDFIGKDQFSVTANLLNLSGDFRFVDFTASILDLECRELARQQARLNVQSDRLSRAALVFHDLKLRGKHLLRIDLIGSRGELIKTQSHAVTLEYQPTSIRLRNPSYRDCVFETMKLKAIEADILLTEQIGKALVATLEGPDYHHSVEIPVSKSENRVSFPFENALVGDYFLSVEGVRKRIRKLPYVEGEIWIDQDNRIYSDGEPFLPFGWFSSEFMHGKEFAFNAGQSYTIHLKSEEAARTFLEQSFQAGRRMLLFPHQSFTGGSPFFHDKKLQGELTAEQQQTIRCFVEAVKNHPGFLGYYATDEPEGRDLNSDWFAAVRQFIAELDPYHPVIMLNCGVSGIQRYHEGGDILMPDYYPVYFSDNSTGQPRRASFDVAKSASNLRPTWFVPQAFDWDWIRDNKIARSPTFDELRAQIFLAAAGDAKGFILYNYYSFGQLSDQLRVGVKYLAAEIKRLKLYLMENSTLLETTESGFIAACKKSAEGICVIAVNTEERAFPVTLDIPGNFTTLHVAGENREIALAGNRLTDDFKAFETRVYLSDASKAGAFSLAAIGEEIRQAGQARFKKGNLLSLGELTLTEIKQRKKGVLPQDKPVVLVSSSRPVTYTDLDYGYFLQDGLCESKPRVPWMSWSPDVNDSKPYVDMRFPQTVEASSVIIYGIEENGKSALRAGRLAVLKNGSFETIAEFHDNQLTVLELKFPALTFQELRLEILASDRAMKCRLLSEIEVYGKIADQ